jgi:hypothetical protein
VSIAVEVTLKLVRAAKVRSEPGIVSSNAWNGLTLRQATRYLRRECSHYG